MSNVFELVKGRVSHNTPIQALKIICDTLTRYQDGSLDLNDFSWLDGAQIDPYDFRTISYEIENKTHEVKVPLGHFPLQLTDSRVLFVPFQ